MKKLFLLLTAFCLFTSSFAAFEVKPALAKKASEILVPVTPQMTISLMDLSTISVKDFQKLTGSHLSLFKKIGFKSLQKKLRKSINADGTVTNQKMLKFVDGGEGGKSQLTALLLCAFVGTLGIHRFYLGYTWQGIVQLLTFGGLGIWTLIDFIRLITGSLKPKNGDYEKTL